MPSEVTLRDAEQNALSSTEPSFYTGSGREQPGQKGKFKGKKAGKSAIIAVLVILGGGAVFLGSTEALLPGALEANVTEETDTQAASGTKRGLIIMSSMLKNGYKPETSAQTRDADNTPAWVDRYDYMTEYMADRFEKNNIKVSEDGTTLNWKDQLTITSDNLMDTYYDNPEFRTDYTNATLGRIVNYYDTSANTSFTRTGNSRNIFKDYTQTNSDADKTEFMDTVNTKFDGDSSKNAFRQQNAEYHEEYCTETDEEGNEETWLCETYYTLAEDEVLLTSVVSAGTSTSSAQSMAEEFISTDRYKIGRVAEHLNWACTTLQISKLITSAISSNTTYQTMNYFLSYMESVSKMKAGYGSESGINEALNHLTQHTTSTVVDYDSVQWNPGATEQIIEWPHYHYDKDGTATLVDTLPETRHIVNPTTFGTYEVDGSMLDAVGMQVLLAGTETVGTAEAIVKTAKDYEVDKLNNTLDRLFADYIKGHPDEFASCDLDETNEEDGTTIHRSLGAKISTGIADAISGFVIDKTGLFVNTVLTGFLAFMSPTIATFLFTSLPETLTGVAGGNYWAMGASIANSYWLGRNASGQTPAAKDVVLAYNRENRELLALEAEMDRVNRSPFDITSKNTFLGSIVHQILPITARQTSTNTLSVLTQTTSKSIASLMGSVSAEGEGSSFMTLFGECTDAEKVGASCNMYGISTATTDTTTIDIDPHDPAYISTIGDQVDNEGKVDPDGNLAKYISYCVNRTSPLGKVDANILNEIRQNEGNPIIRFLRDAPFIGDLLSGIFETLGSFKNIKEEYIKWADGTYCVNNTSINPETGEIYNELWEDEIKYYQRYYEDVRKLDQLGAFDNNALPTISYQEQYEATHPWTTDNSQAGYLARIAGMSKDDAELVLDVLDYYAYLSTYDPTTRVAFTDDTTKVKTSDELIADISTQKIWLNQTTPVDQPETPVLADRTIYADIRNRSYAV